MTKLLCLILLTVFCYPGLSQPVKVLSLKHKKYYEEKDQFNADSVLFILCEVCYDDPATVDEEHCVSLSIIVKNTAAFYESKFLDIERDTAIISCSYNRISISKGNRQKNKISGKIWVVAFSSDLIKLRMNVSVSGNQNYIYKGRRIFKRSKQMI